MKTECSIVKDLLPLYVEDLLRPETAQYVKEHLESCPECEKELACLKEGEAFENTPTACTKESKTFKNLMKRVNMQFHSLAYAALIFLIILGFGWTGEGNLMYNSVIMPVVGVFGYYVFRWKAIYKLPILLLIIDLLVYLFQLVEVGLPDALVWTFIYCIFVLIGIVIAFLMHFAFRKEERK